MKIIYSWSIFIAFLPISALADEHEAQAFKGIGFIKCSEFIELEVDDMLEVGDRGAAMVVSWFYGYWTGKNLKLRAEVGTMRDLNRPEVKSEALIARLIGKCYERKDDVIVEVGDDLFFSLPEIANE